MKRCPASPHPKGDYIERVNFLAFTLKLIYNYKNKKVAKSLLGLSLMPARTLNDFFAGFFYGQIKIDIEVNMTILLGKCQERVKEIKVEGEREKEAAGLSNGVTPK